MNKHAFQALKRMFTHVSGLTPPYFDFKKNQLLYQLFFLNQNMLGKI